MATVPPQAPMPSEGPPTLPVKPDPNWIELAKIVSARITNRRETEWKLVLQHLGGLAACVYFASTSFREDLQAVKCMAVVMCLILATLSLVISFWWVSAIQKAHAYDATKYAYYMDKARDLINSPTVSAVELAKSEKREFDAILNIEQKDWKKIHFGSSVLIHVLAAAAIITITLDGVSPAKKSSSDDSKASQEK